MEKNIIKEEYIMVGQYYGRCIEGNLKTYLYDEIEKCNEPLVVSSQYGWRDGGVDRDYNVIYPPFKYTTTKKGDVYEVGVVKIECSKKMGMIEYVKENFDKMLPEENEELKLYHISEYVKDELKELYNIKSYNSKFSKRLYELSFEKDKEMQFASVLDAINHSSQVEELVREIEDCFSEDEDKKFENVNIDNCVVDMYIFRAKKNTSIYMKDDSISFNVNIRHLSLKYLQDILDVVK